jgi:diadenosine tetraphosphate (Ap4A) HIT family hydrolase
MATPEQDCTFCEIIPNPRSAFDVHQDVGEGKAALVPALGMLLPGYLLAVSKEHTTSFSQYNEPQLRDTDDALNEVEDNLSPFFGEYFRWESGSDNSTGSCGSGACIDHAHLHLVPDADTGLRLLDELPWQQIGAYDDIVNFRDKPYAYLGRIGLHYVAPEPNLPGQWMRRQVAKTHDLDNWDWAIDPGLDNLTETMNSLKKSQCFQRLATTALNMIPKKL